MLAEMTGTYRTYMDSVSTPPTVGNLNSDIKTSWFGILNPPLYHGPSYRCGIHSVWGTILFHANDGGMKRLLMYIYFWEMTISSTNFQKTLKVI